MREKICLDKNWMFQKGDIKMDFPPHKAAAYNSAKTERMLWGPASQNYNTSPIDATERWDAVDLPHDYVVGGETELQYNNALGFLPYDNAWYRKSFRLDYSDKDKRITLFFEGVATHATIYLNGCLLKRNFCGYTSFEVDITDFVKFDGENILAVYVNTDEHEGWWYEGGGIYRHVWLCKTELVSVDLWGVYVKPREIENGKWIVETETTVRNDTDKKQLVSICGEIIDANGNTVATSNTSGYILQRDKKAFNYSFELNSPALWSPDEANLYTMRTKVIKGKVEFDVYDTRFGCRTIVADPQNGLFINGKHYKIQGLCGHADFGLSIDKKNARRSHRCSCKAW